MTSSFRRVLAGFATTALLACAAPNTVAQVTTITFDDVNTGGNGTSITGAPVSSYLASYGITFSSASSGISPVIEDPMWLTPASESNVFGTFGSASLYSYTLSFENVLNSFSFTRVGTIQAWMSAWTATAYSATNTVLASVGESSMTGHYGAPSQSFALSGAGSIDHIVFTDNAFNFAGTNARFDNFVLDQVAAPIPEPETYAMLLVGLALVAFETRRRRKGLATAG